MTQAADPVPEAARPDGTPGLLTLFTTAIAVGAALLFMVQPMAGKLVLPRGGGSPQVWNTSMVFFQTALLAGYAYAHYSIRWLGVRRQAGLHTLVLLAPFAFLPLALPDAAAPESGSQVAWILYLLTAGVGLPFFVLAAASPLLQRWLASTGHRAAKDPYFLYAGSNAGSLVGLMAYPLVMEPMFGLRVQSMLWSAGYGAFVLLAAVCAVVAIRSHRGPRAGPSPVVSAASDSGTTSATDATGQAGLTSHGQPHATSDGHPHTTSGPGTVRPSGRDRLFWMSAAAVPSALLLGVTQYLTSQIAPVPLLWVLPLALYLITFIVAFARRQVVSVSTVSRLLAMAAVITALTLLTRIADPVWAIVAMHLGLLTLGALLCHLRLAQSRPPVAYLTEFYLLISTGGALGGMFAALVAPVAFDFIAEYPIALVLACLFRLPTAREDGPRPSGNGRAVADVALPWALAMYVFGVQWASRAFETLPDAVSLTLAVLVPTAVAFLFAARPLRFALGLAVLLGFAQSGDLFRGELLHTDRTFFGVYTVAESQDGATTIFYHGSTAHGIQSTDPARVAEPFAYYHPTGPAGRVLTATAGRTDQNAIALVGGGTGALAVYAAPHQNVTLYEIDAAVARLAEDPDFFRYLDASRASWTTVVGDGRIELAATDERYDVIVLDAFSSGSIPVHLLTREAVQLYLDRLKPGGLLLFHISNRHLSLGPVLARHAQDLGLTAFENVDLRSPTDDPAIFPSHWVAFARSVGDFAHIPPEGWAPLSAPGGGRTWTDDFSNLLTVLRWD